MLKVRNVSIRLIVASDVIESTPAWTVQSRQNGVSSASFARRTGDHCTGSPVLKGRDLPRSGLK